MERYNFKVIEKKWQNFWEKNKSFKTEINKNCKIVSSEGKLNNELKLAILKKAAIFEKEKIVRTKEEYKVQTPE